MRGTAQAPDHRIVVDAGLSVASWALACSPVLLLLALVLAGVKTSRASVVVITWVCGIGAVAFQAPAATIVPALLKGVWLGVWILCVVWPALLLYRLASGAGLERIGRIFSTILPLRRENLLVVAWIFPAFIQGIAGFGTPIAVAAPLLVAMGWSRSRAVIYPLIGYHWSVTFGSMGSSFYMASLTANLGVEGQAAFALTASSFLAVQCIVAGALVLLMDGGWAGLREGWRLLTLAGVAMGGTLIATVRLVPAVGSLAAGAVGLIVVAGYSAFERRRRRAEDAALVRFGSHQALRPGSGDPGSPEGSGTAPSDASAEEVRPPLALLSPYLYLLATALPVFLWTPSRDFVQGSFVLAFDFPGSRTGLGWDTSPVEAYTPIALFGHPGFYITLACVLGYVTYRRLGLWSPGGTRVMLSTWLRSLPQASISVVLLACVATVLTDTGMVSVLAGGIASVTGAAFPALAPIVGATGSFITGSTTSSNALFAALQRDVALLIDLPPHVLLAAQTAGGNVGNALAPVVILIGVTAVDGAEDTGEVLRRCLLPAAVLGAVVIAATFIALG
jgi:lactate permease